MKLTKKRNTPESREYWEFVEKTAKEVADWPDWKKGRVQEPKRIRESEPAPPGKRPR